MWVAEEKRWSPASVVFSILHPHWQTYTLQTEPERVIHIHISYNIHTIFRFLFSHHSLSFYPFPIVLYVVNLISSRDAL